MTFLRGRIAAVASSGAVPGSAHRGSGLTTVTLIRCLTPLARSAAGSFNVGATKAGKAKNRPPINPGSTEDAMRAVASRIALASSGLALLATGNSTAFCAEANRRRMTAVSALRGELR